MIIFLKINDVGTKSLKPKYKLLLSDWLEAKINAQHYSQFASENITVLHT